MGVQGVLPRLLASVGHPIDLRSFQNGILADDDESNNSNDIFPSNTSDGNEQQHGKKRPRRNDDDDDDEQPKRKKRKRRKIRIGLDVSLWISRALHGHGASLLDERVLTNCGRAQLFMERQQQKQRQGEENGNDATSSNANTTTDSTKNGKAQQQQQSYKEMAEAQYIQKCTSYVISRIEALKQATNCDLLVVFDGNTPPAKYNETSKRRKQRDDAAKSLQQDEGKEQEEKEDRDESEEEAIRNKIKAAKKASTSQTSSSTLHSLVLSSLLSSLRSLKIPFLISPYESDGQLAYLAAKKYIDVVITDDSDLLAYGCIDNLIYKVCQAEEDEQEEDEVDDDEEDGNDDSEDVLQKKKEPKRHYIPHKGILLQKSDLGGGRFYCSSSRSQLNFMDFSNAMMATTFVAAGCDYCSSLRGVGILTARNIVKESFHSAFGVLTDDYEESNGGIDGSCCSSASSTHQHSNERQREITNAAKSNDDIVLPLPRVLTKLFKATYNRKTMTQEQKQEYEDQFLKALISFRHCVVYDPKTCSCIFSNFSGSNEEDADEDDWLLQLYPPYAELCQDKKTLESIVGRLYDKEEATYIAEGWVNPRTGRLHKWYDGGETETPREVVQWWDRKSRDLEVLKQKVKLELRHIGRGCIKVPLNTHPL